MGRRHSGGARPRAGGEETFVATLRLAGVNPYVDVPHWVVQRLDDDRRSPVLVRVHPEDATEGSSANTSDRLAADDADRLRKIGRLTPDGWFRSTLVPSRSGPTRLYLDQWMRAVAQVGVGDRVRIRLSRDPWSRELPVPDALRVALEASPSARARWDELAPSRRREILSYLNFLTTPAAIERNVRKTIAALRLRRPR